LEAQVKTLTDQVSQLKKTKTSKEALVTKANGEVAELINKHTALQHSISTSKVRFDVEKKALECTIKVRE
jgi:hypothetical protein